jgi:hypothetical protein
LAKANILRRIAKTAQKKLSDMAAKQGERAKLKPAAKFGTKRAPTNSRGLHDQ